MGAGEGRLLTLKSRTPVEPRPSGIYDEKTAGGAASFGTPVTFGTRSGVSIKKISYEARTRLKARGDVAVSLFLIQRMQNLDRRQSKGSHITTLPKELSQQRTPQLLLFNIIVIVLSPRPQKSPVTKFNPGESLTEGHFPSPTGQSDTRRKPA